MNLVRWFASAIVVLSLLSLAGLAGPDGSAVPAAWAEPPDLPSEAAQAGLPERGGAGTPLDDDAHSGMDADNECTPGGPPQIILPVNGSSDGSVLPLLDESDVYGIQLEAGDVLVVTVTSAPGVPVHANGIHQVAAYDASCSALPHDPVPSGIRFQAERAGLHHLDIRLDLPLVAAQGEAPHTDQPSRLDEAAPGAGLCHPPCTFYGYRQENHRE